MEYQFLYKLLIGNTVAVPKFLITSSLLFFPDGLSLKFSSKIYIVIDIVTHALVYDILITVYIQQ